MLGLAPVLDAGALHRRIFLPAVHGRGVIPEPAGLPSGYRIGVHCIGDFDARTGANHAAAQGAPVVMVLGSKPSAVELKRRYPGTLVVFRALLPNFLITVDQMMSLLNVRADDPQMFYVGLNEGDQNVDTSPAAIHTRAAFDRAVAARVRAANPSAVYIAGSYAHGEPRFADDAVAAAFREAYAPGYNAGEYWFDLHNYTLGRRFASHPPANAPINDPANYERLWEQLFVRCGFDPALRHIVATETGVEAGSGGFPWAGYSAGQFAEWMAEHRRIQTAPLAFPQGSFPSPFRWCTIFQYGNDSAWSVYNVNGFLGQLQSEWAIRPAALDPYTVE
jgi:hypothetical protein